MNRICTRGRIIIASILWFGLAAAAKDERAVKAKEHYETGMAHYRLEEWDEAVKEFEAGFRVKPAPQFLYNIAQAYRLSKRPEKALSFYQKYLQMDPRAPNKAEVEAHIKNLGRVVQEQQRAVDAQPTAPMPESGRPGSTTKGARRATPVAMTTAPSAPRAEPEPEVTEAEGQVPEAALTPVAPEATPAPKRKMKPWVWGVIGGGTAVVATVVVVGVVAGTADNTPIAPAVRF